MASYTIQDLAKRTLQNLRVLDAQEDVAAEDFALINDAYAQKYEELFFRELAYWPVDEIDGKIFTALARIMAEEVAVPFGQTVPIEFGEGGEQISMGTKGLRDLRRIVAREKSGLPTPGVFF